MSLKTDIVRTFGGRSLKLRPSFLCYETIEELTGKSTLQITDAFVQDPSSIPMKHLAAIVYGGAIGAGEQISFDEVKELLAIDGPSNHYLPTLIWLFQSLRGRKVESEEALKSPEEKAVETQKKTLNE